MSKDYYKILNVDRDAGFEEIHKAYRSLAFRYHPDRNRTQAAAILMATINEAYEVLSKPKKRTAYDAQHSKRATGVTNAVLRAAHDTLLKRNWSLVEDRNTEIVLKNGPSRVFVALAASLDPGVFRGLRKRSDCFSVILAARVEPQFNVASASIAVIDLMHSRLHGSFPSKAHADLFQPFL